MMVGKVEAPDPTTVAFDLEFATTAFLPARRRVALSGGGV
jgi:hypothetical protein